MEQLIREHRLFAILDACDAPLVLEKVRSMGEENAPCLFRGPLDPQILAEAPYLVRATSELVGWLVETVWQEPWGIFVITNLGLADLRKHLRKLLMVEGPEGDALYFRYYDPRVLRTFCSHCEEEEARQFFGPAQAFGAANGNSRNIDLFFLQT